jgi:hypothetical protein
MMYTKSKYKTFNAPLLSIRRKSPMQMQKTQSKRFQTKHALKAMRTERKQVEVCSNKKSIKYLTTNKHPRNTNTM